MVGANNATSEYDGIIGINGGPGTANINVTKIGGGTLTLGGANNYTGNTTIGNGVLALGSSGSIASSAQISVSNSAAFNVSQVAGGWSMGANQILFVTNATLSAASINGGAASTTIALANATVNLTGTAGSLAAPISTFSTSNSVLNLAAISFATTNISVSTLNTGGAGNTINITNFPGSFPTYPVTVSLIRCANAAATTPNFAVNLLNQATPAVCLHRQSGQFWCLLGHHRRPSSDATTRMGWHLCWR